MSATAGADPEQNSMEQEQGQPTASEQSLGVERRIPSVNRVRSMQSRVTAVLTIGVMCALALALLAWYYSRAFFGDSAATSHGSKQRSGSTADTLLPTLVEMPEPPPVESPAITESLASTTQRPRPSRGAAVAVPERQLIAPVFARSRSGSVSSSGARTTTVPAPKPLGSGGERAAEEGAGSELSSLLRVTGHGGAVATQLVSPQMTLRAGTHIPCTLESAITTSLPGTTRCITAADTWSADGKVVLIERGTTVFGETRGVASEGNHRIFIVWTHAYTPHHVDVPLDAPGTDALGRSGVAGDVDYHFFQRFGAAMLISVIDGVTQAASRSRVGDDSIIISPSSSRDLLTEILRQTAGVRPTSDVFQGAQLQIAVPRNVDFGGVYELVQSH